jgi:hypothetical protein
MYNPSGRPEGEDHKSAPPLTPATTSVFSTSDSETMSHDGLEEQKEKTTNLNGLGCHRSTLKPSRHRTRVRVSARKKRRTTDKMAQTRGYRRRRQDGPRKGPEDSCGTRRSLATTRHDGPSGQECETEWWSQVSLAAAQATMASTSNPSSAKTMMASGVLLHRPAVLNAFFLRGTRRGANAGRSRNLGFSISSSNGT